MLTLIRGLPGAGKTTYAQKNWPGALLLEGDQYFMTPEGRYEFGKGLLSNSTEYVAIMLETAFRIGTPHVVVTGTSPDYEAFGRYVEIAKKYGHGVRKIWLDLMNGNTSLNLHRVPDEVIESMMNKWQLTEGEAVFGHEILGLSGRHEYSTYKVGSYPRWFEDKQRKEQNNAD